MARMGRCFYEQCKTSARFNVEGSKTPGYFGEHAHDGMVDVRSKRCIRCSCARQPNFNIQGSMTAVYCKQHAEDGMVNVNSKRCTHDSCPKFPSFNVEGIKTAAYCQQHAELGMVNVRTGRALSVSRTVKLARDGSTNVLEAACNMPESNSVDSSVINGRKRSRFELDGNQLPPFLDHGLVNLCVGPAVGMDSTIEGPHISSSLALKRSIKNTIAGTDIKQTIPASTPSVGALGRSLVSCEPIKPEFDVSVLF